MESRPKTVNDAVKKIITDFTEKDKKLFVANYEKSCGFHMELGMQIRNDFGLWGDNKELIRDCDRIQGEKFGEGVNITDEPYFPCIDADTCSSLILEKVLAELKRVTNQT